MPGQQSVCTVVMLIKIISDKLDCYFFGASDKQEVGTPTVVMLLLGGFLISSFVWLSYHTVKVSTQYGMFFSKENSTRTHRISGFSIYIRALKLLQKPL